MSEILDKAIGGSAFGRALFFYRQFKKGYFSSQEEMAKAVGVSQGLISRMMRAAELIEHDCFKALFRKGFEIGIKPACKLVKLLNGFKKSQLEKTADTLQRRMETGEQLTSKQILKILFAAVVDGDKEISNLTEGR